MKHKKKSRSLIEKYNFWRKHPQTWIPVTRIRSNRFYFLIQRTLQTDSWNLSTRPIDHSNRIQSNDRPQNSPVLRIFLGSITCVWSPVTIFQLVSVSGNEKFIYTFFLYINSFKIISRESEWPPLTAINFFFVHSFLVLKNKNI